MQAMLRRLPLDKINPFDDLHRPSGPGFCVPSDVGNEHLSGVEHCVTLMRQGKPIRPIVVMPIKLSKWYAVYPEKEYQRLDGFKRYWAHKVEGKAEIDCVIIDEYWPGAQHGHPMTIEDEEWATLTRSS